MRNATHGDHVRPATCGIGVAFAVLLTVSPLWANPMGSALGASPMVSRPRVSVNGPFLILHGSGSMGGSGEILIAESGRVIQILARGLPSPSDIGIASSPQGRYVAFSEDATIAPGNPPRTQGLWLVPTKGGAPRRLLLPPRSVEGNQLDIGPIAWSPDQQTLAYAVNPSGGGMNTSYPEPALGIWLTRYDHVHPHLLVTTAQLGAVGPPPLRTPLVINRLSWSSDGHTLAVSTFRCVPGATSSEQTTPVILAVDTRTGTVRLLISWGQDGVFAPMGSALAYTSPGVGAAKGTTLQIADGQGRHRRNLVRGPISSPTWSPNGRSFAYIVGSTEIRTFDIATGKSQSVLTIMGHPRNLLPAGGQFVRLVWMPTHQ